MGSDEAALAAVAGENAVKPSRRTSRATSSSSSGSQPRISIAAGTSGIPAQSHQGQQRRVRHPALRWMAATLDGMVEGNGAVFESKFMLPWSFSEEAAAEKHMAQLQHNMWVIASRTSVLSIITGGGKWVEIAIQADPLYQHLLLTAEKKFWRCVQSGEPPRLFGVEPPRPRIEAVRVVDMSASNSWAEFAGLYCRTRSAFLDHERRRPN